MSKISAAEVQSRLEHLHQDPQCHEALYLQDIKLDNLPDLSVMRSLKVLVMIDMKVECIPRLPLKLELLVLNDTEINILGPDCFQQESMYDVIREGLIFKEIYSNDLKVNLIKPPNEVFLEGRVAVQQYYRQGDLLLSISNM